MPFVVARISKGKMLLEGLELRSWAGVLTAYLVVLHDWGDSLAYDLVRYVGCIPARRCTMT